MTTINWKYKGKNIDSIDKVPEGAIGIIYKITNITNGKYYYGRKTILSLRKRKLTKKEQALSENGKKKVTREVKEVSGWKKYCGSNKPLLEDIKNGDKYKKEIIQFCFSKAEMTYYETVAIICNGGLLDENCYNSWCSMRCYSYQLIKTIDEQ